MNTTLAVKEKLENILKGIKKYNGSSVANILTSFDIAIPAIGIFEEVEFDIAPT